MEMRSREDWAQIQVKPRVEHKKNFENMKKHIGLE
jgi:hypothetical protein